MPLDYKETDGALSWEVGGRAGVQSYNENASAYFPEDANLQSQLEAEAANSTTLQAYFPAQSASGIVGGANASFEYELNNTFLVGGKLTYDRTGNWNNTLALLYARYDPRREVSRRFFEKKRHQKTFVRLGLEMR